MNKNKPYNFFNSFILRTPHLSFNFIDDDFSDDNKTKDICKRAEIQEALFIASPSLFNELQDWLNEKLTDKKKIERLKYSLMRYLIRMSTRPTPFGLFAGFNLGQWDNETKIELKPKEEDKRHTRLDMNYLCALAQDLAKHPLIKNKIKYFPNSSIYQVGEQLRYVEYRYKNTNRTHHIVAVDNSEYLQKILSVAERGEYLNELSNILVDDEITFEEAEGFINEIVGSQLLVNELEPAITGPEFLEQILSVIKNIYGTENIVEVLEKVKNKLDEIDNEKIGTTTKYYFEIEEELGKLPTKYVLKYLFQTDMVKNVDNCILDAKIQEQILDGFEILNKLTPQVTDTNLSRFREAFYERYEEKEMPLLHVLDTEVGIGYLQNKGSDDINPLVDNLALPITQTTSEIRWDRIQSFLFEKYQSSLQENKYEIELKDEELKDFPANWDNLPNTMSSMVSVIGKNENGYIIQMSGASGSSAANLLGRFCHSDKHTNNFVKEIIQLEEKNNPEIIFAEIIHLPESRIGNILLRPILRKYEIPYLAKSAVGKDFQINLQDLFLSISGGRIVLRSKKLNKEIIPRLSSAHNYSFNALPIYQFLCDMQSQNLRNGIGFNWGYLANEYKFLPRVNYKNLIFSLATWNIKKEDVKHLYEIKDDSKLLDNVKIWREKNKIPVQVSLKDGDNDLYINLENPFFIRTLFSVVKNRPFFKLVEFIFDKENVVVKNQEGAFTNEFIFSFFRE